MKTSTVSKSWRRTVSFHPRSHGKTVPRPPLGGTQLDRTDRDGGREEAAVVADQVERSAAAQSQPEDPRVGAVEHAETVQSRIDAERRIERAVDQRVLAHETRRLGVVDEIAALVEVRVANDQRNLAGA